MTAPTRQTYSRLLTEFLCECRLPNLNVADRVLDQLLANKFETLYLEGRDAGRGQKLLASIVFWFPVHAGRTKPSLPRSMRSMKGW